MKKKTVYGKEEYSVLEGVVYLLTKEFDMVKFVSKEEFDNMTGTTKDDNIEELDVFVESDYMIQTNGTEYLLYVLGETIDLPKTYKIVRHAREIKLDN